MASLIQPSLGGGELAPAAWGRVDLARYQSSLKTCRNFITRVYGGCVNRTGTALVVEILGKQPGDRVRLLPFQFSTEQSYSLAFSDNTMRVVKDGGIVLEAPLPVTGVANSEPIEVTTDVPHGFSNGDQVFITGIDDHPVVNNKFWVVTNVTELNLNAFGLAGTTLPGFSSSDAGTVLRVYTLATEISQSQLRGMKYAQLADIMTLVEGSTHPKQLSRLDHDDWTIADFDNREGPFLDINSDRKKGVTASAVTGSIILHASHPIFTGAMVGVLVYLEQKDGGTPWEVAKAVSAGDIRRSEGKYYKALNAGTTGTLRPSHEDGAETDGAVVQGNSLSDGAVRWEYLHSGYGVAKITAFVDANTVTASVKRRLPEDVVGAATQNITGAANNGAGLIRLTAAGHGYSNDDFILVYDVGGTVEANGFWKITGATANTFDLVDSAFVNAYTSGGKVVKGATYKYALGAWGGEQGFPSSVSYHGQRQWFASTPKEVQKAWGSGVQAFRFFGKSTPLLDDDSVNFLLAAQQVNAIRHMISMGALLCFTNSELWKVGGGDNNAITPSAVFPGPQESSGSSEVPPLKVKDSLLYLHRHGKQVLDLRFDFSSDSFAGNDISVLAAHLFEKHQVVDWAYQNTPYRVVWMVRDDGVLIGLTYLREQQVWGWHRHDTQDGRFESVCCIPEGDEDAVYFSVIRNVAGTERRFIERLTSRLFTDVRDAVFMDCAVSFDGRNSMPPSVTMELNTATDWLYTTVLSLTCNTNFFNPQQVDLDEIHFPLADGTILRARIVAFFSSQIALVNVDRNVPIELQSVATANWWHAKKQFSSLSQYRGKTVAILADGHVHPPQHVSANETVVLDHAAVVVHIGLPIEADIETLSMAPSSAETLIDKQKLVSAVRVLVEETRGIAVGKDAGSLMEFKTEVPTNYDARVEAKTELLEVRIPTTWDKGGRVFIRQSDPLPASVLAIIPEVSAGGA